jgi:hypothetical protein
VTEHLRHDLDVHSGGGERQRRGTLPQVVETDRGQAGGFELARERERDLGRVEEGAVVLGEDRAGRLPGRAPAGLLFALFAERVDRLGVQSDQALPAVGLRSRLVHSSAGKESLVMLHRLATWAVRVGCKDKVVVVHCDLGDTSEWPGVRELAQRQAERYGLRFVAVDSGGGLLGLVVKRGMFPDAARRLCTSSLKRDKANVLLTEIVAALGLDRQAIVINCLGIRAAALASSICSAAPAAPVWATGAPASTSSASTSRRPRAIPSASSKATPWTPCARCARNSTWSTPPRPVRPIPP